MAAHERGRWVRFLTRHDVWNSRAARAMDGMRHIPVDREVPASAYLTARRLLREGEAVGIFPEAGISHAYAVRSLMRGPAALARETGAALVRLALWGTQRIWSVDPGTPGQVPRPSRRRHQRVDVVFGEPLVVRPGDDLVAATARLGHALTDLLEGLQRMPEHVPAPGEHAPWYPPTSAATPPTGPRR